MREERRGSEVKVREAGLSSLASRLVGRFSRNPLDQSDSLNLRLSSCDCLPSRLDSQVISGTRHAIASLSLSRSALPSRFTTSHVSVSWKVLS